MTRLAARAALLALAVPPAYFSLLVWLLVKRPDLQDWAEL